MSFVEQLRGRVGDEFFTSDWFEIRQVDVDVFSANTRDWDYMHNDPVWASEKGPWGGTIAHGFYLLSLVSQFQGAAGFPIVATDDEFVVNYGIDRLRFTEPVLVGDNVRAVMTLLAIEERKLGRELIRTRVVYESERCGPGHPHMVAESLALSVSGAAMSAAR